jgi:hypothetical protein
MATVSTSRCKEDERTLHPVHIVFTCLAA